MKKLQHIAVFFMLLIFFNIIAVNVKGQLRKDFINMLPDSVRPADAGKNALTISEKINILKTVNIVAHKQFNKTYDSIAAGLEDDEVAADTTSKILIEDELATYYKKLQMLEISLQHCNAYLKLAKANKAYSAKRSEVVMMKGAMLANIGRYEESIVFLYSELERYKTENDSIGIANVFSGLAYPYLSLQLPETALSYLDSSTAYFAKPDFRSKPDKRSWVFFSTMLQNNYLACLLLYEKTGSTNYINKMKSITDILTYQKIPCPIPKTFPALLAYSQGRFDSTIDIANLLMAEPVTEDFFSNQYKIWILQKYKALSFYHKGQKDEAAIQLQLCIDSIQQYIKRTGSSMGFGKYYIDNISQYLYQYFANKNDWQKAYFYLSLNKQIEDSLAILGNRGKIFEVSQKYNYAKKELAVTQLQNDNLLRKKQAMLAIAITAISLLIFIVIALLLHNKNRQLKLKKQQADKDAQNNFERLGFTSQLQIAELEEKNLLITMQEKKRLGRELHDDLAGDLAGIKLKMDIESANATDTDQKSRLIYITTLLEEAYKTTRAKSHDWYSSADQQLENSFVERIKTIMDKGLPQGMFATELTVDKDCLQNISLRSRIELLYIIKECIMNILKHSGANKIQVLLYKDLPGLILYIADNGKGFDSKIITKGIGLKSMKERAASINGQITINSSSSGTEIKVIVPDEIINVEDNG